MISRNEMCIRDRIHFVVEFAPRVSADQLGLVTRRKVLPCAESVDHVGRIELLAVETGPEEHGVVVVQRGVDVYKRQVNTNSL